MAPCAAAASAAAAAATAVAAALAAAADTLVLLLFCPLPLFSDARARTLSPLRTPLRVLSSPRSARSEEHYSSALIHPQVRGGASHPRPPALIQSHPNVSLYIQHQWRGRV